MPLHRESGHSHQYLLSIYGHPLTQDSIHGQRSGWLWHGEYCPELDGRINAYMWKSGEAWSGWLFLFFFPSVDNTWLGMSVCCWHKAQPTQSYFHSAHVPHLNLIFFSLALNVKMVDFDTPEVSLCNVFLRFRGAVSKLVSAIDCSSLCRELQLATNQSFPLRACCCLLPLLCKPLTLR